MSTTVYRVHGMMQSYFTRKMTGYLDYKGIPWLFRRFPGVSPESAAGGFPGGVPVVETPTGTFMWDSTSMIHYFEQIFPQPRVMSDDSVPCFLDYVVEDFADEWLYRPAVGSRWHFEENAAVGGFELARDIATRMPVPCDQAFAGVRAHVRSTCPGLGVDESNIHLWIDEVLRPWQRVLGEHLAQRPYLFGERPGLADFGLYGGNAAHFANDPLCRRWLDADAPSVVQHTHRLLEPTEQQFGAREDWRDAEQVPVTLIAVLAAIGQHYLPWVSRACVQGHADVAFSDGTRVTIEASDFLRDARATLLARYNRLRCERLDAVLERAGILPYFRDYTAYAGSIPANDVPPQPRLNRPFAPPGE